MLPQKKSKKFIALCKKYGVDPANVPEIMDFKAACKITGDDPATLTKLAKFVKNLPRRHQKYMIAAYARPIIAEAFKNNKRPDYTDRNQIKHNAVFLVKADKKRPSGFGLACSDGDDWGTFSCVGVRLSFMNLDTVRFFGMHFMQLHKDYMLYT